MQIIQKPGIVSLVLLVAVAAGSICASNINECNDYNHRDSDRDYNHRHHHNHHDDDRDDDRDNCGWSRLRPISHHLSIKVNSADFAYSAVQKIRIKNNRDFGDRDNCRNRGQRDTILLNYDAADRINLSQVKYFWQQFNGDTVTNYREVRVTGVCRDSRENLLVVKLAEPLKQNEEGTLTMYTNSVIPEDRQTGSTRVSFKSIGPYFENERRRGSLRYILDVTHDNRLKVTSSLGQMDDKNLGDGLMISSVSSRQEQMPIEDVTFTLRRT